MREQLGGVEVNEGAVGWVEVNEGAVGWVGGE